MKNILGAGIPEFAEANPGHHTREERSLPEEEPVPDGASVTAGRSD